MANELFKPYAKETYGYDVNFSFEEAPFESLFQKAATSLQSGSAQYNIIISDSQWLGALAEPGWIVRLNDIIAENPELDIQFEEAAAIGYRIYPDGSDNIYGFPQEGDTIALFVRQDLMIGPGRAGRLQGRQRRRGSAADLRRVARGRHRPLRADLPALHPAGRESLRHRLPVVEGLRLRLLLRLPVHVLQRRRGLGPGHRSGRRHAQLRDQHRRPGAQQALPPVRPAGRHELRHRRRGRRLHGRHDRHLLAVVGARPADAEPELAGGEPGEVADAERPVTPEMVLIALPPGFPQEDGTLNRVYTLGGQPWVLNAFNDEAHQQVAIDFMKFWYLPETQLEFSRRGGNSAVTAVLEDPGYEDLQPHFRAYKYMIRENRSRDFWHDPNYAEMLAVQQEAWNGYITDVVPDAKLALDYTACKQQGILYDAGRTDIEPSEACADISI